MPATWAPASSASGPASAACSSGTNITGTIPFLLWLWYKCVLWNISCCGGLSKLCQHLLFLVLLVLESTSILRERQQVVHCHPVKSSSSSSSAASASSDLSTTASATPTAALDEEVAGSPAVPCGWLLAATLLEVATPEPLGRLFLEEESGTTSACKAST